MSSAERLLGGGSGGWAWTGDLVGVARAAARRGGGTGAGELDWLCRRSLILKFLSMASLRLPARLLRLCGDRSRTAPISS